MADSRTQLEYELEQLYDSHTVLEEERMQLRDLLHRCSTMLDQSLCPYIDHPEAFAWIEERRVLLAEIRSVLDANTHDTEEVC